MSAWTGDRDERPPDDEVETDAEWLRRTEMEVIDRVQSRYEQGAQDPALARMLARWTAMLARTLALPPYA